MKKILSVLCFTALVASAAVSQETLKSIEEDYYDFLSLTGIVERPTLGYRTLSDSEWSFNTDETVEINHPWQNNNLGKKYTLLDLQSLPSNFFFNGFDTSIKVKFYGPKLFNSYNTVQPYGFNDGGMWQGVGYNAALTGGLRIEAFGFELTYKPQISFCQNKDFDYMTGTLNPFGYFTDGSSGGVIDIVQRYGDSSFWNYDWGDSEVRYTFYNFTVGFGTENPWIGPSYINPMLGSNNAGAYPKLDIGFRKTAVYLPWNNFYLGDIEARAFTGKLAESKYFDNDTSNDSRMINALFIGVSPFFIPGLTIGANRIILTGWDKRNFKYFGRLFTLSSDNDVAGPGEDQKVSVFFDYLFPSVGFEVYGELGLDDFTADKSSNPFHTAIYTLGIKQDIPLWNSATAKNVKSQLIFEYNNFEMSQDFQMQWPYGGYYYHGQIKQGYTQNGQILGAGSGALGNSQLLKYTVFYPKGKTSLFVHRSCPNNNFIYNKAVTSNASYGSEIHANYYSAFLTYFDIGLETSFFATKSLIISGTVVYDYIHCFKYKRLLESGSFSNDIQNNFHFELNAKYNF